MPIGKKKKGNLDPETILKDIIELWSKSRKNTFVVAKFNDSNVAYRVAFAAGFEGKKRIKNPEPSDMKQPEYLG